MSVNSYKVPYSGKVMKLTSDTPQKRSFALKNHLARRKVRLWDVLTSLGYEPKNCTFCGQRNDHFLLVTQITNGHIQISGLDYTFGGTTDAFYYCRSADCPGKTLNPNSCEFVRGAMGLASDDDAYAYIHKRNSTPFYANNHVSADDYRLYQSRSTEWLIAHGCRDAPQRANHSRSLGGQIERYGEIEGARRYKEYNAKKAITYDNLICLYDEATVLKKLADHRRCITTSLEGHLRRYGYVEGHLRYFERFCHNTVAFDKIQGCDDLVQFGVWMAKHDRDHCDYHLTVFPLSVVLEKSALVRVGLRFFELSIDELVEMIKQTDPSICGTRCTRTRCPAGNIVSYTEDGRLLRSSKELRFYNAIKESKWPFEIGKRYPNSTMRYDFFFPSVRVYVEIGGYPNDSNYVQKMRSKEKTFGAWILWSNRDQDQAIEKLEVLHAR